MMDLSEYAGSDALTLAAAVRSGTVTAADLAHLAFEAAARVDPGLNAIRELYSDRLDPADLPSGGPFAGVPFLLKDLTATEAGRLHECGSLLLKGMVAESDSAFTRRCRTAGLNIIGRTSAPEFGWSASTESRLSGITRNPWNLARSAGGSSGGAASAVAAGVVPVAHASDGSGSIRNPAGWCGLVGLKPSRGRISNAPGVGMPPGGRPAQFIVSRSLRDSAAALDALSGAEPGDPFEIAAPAGGFLAALASRRRPLRISWTVTAPSGGPTEAETADAVRTTARLLESMGHQVVEAAPVFDWDQLVEAILTTASAGIAGRIDAIAAQRGLAPSTNLLQHTTFAAYQHGKTRSAADLLAAIAVLDRISRGVAGHYHGFDLNLSPTSTRTAPPHGTHDADARLASARAWSDVIHAEDAFLLMANVTGHPALSVPLHQGSDGLPIGIQLETRFGGEAQLFALAAELAEALPWAERRPGVHVAGPSHG